MIWAKSSDVRRYALGFASAFTNLRTDERCDDMNALLAAILADATNFGLGRMAAASYGVTRDKLIWTADAYIRPNTYKSALARIIDAHHALPIATSCGDATGEVNARYGHDPSRSPRRTCCTGSRCA